jgi:YebC/PmpR family DNA-binding regulatory protein
MSGHSKWAQIKHQKGANDAKRGQLFTKLARELTIATREGGPNPDGNVRLRLAIQKAKENNLPGENIERAIKRAAGGEEGAALEEIMYEGYAPGGAAVLVEVATDNRNRTAAEVRNAFSRGGGNMGEAGCVAWLFDSRGVVAVELDGQDPDEVALQAIDAGAEDVKVEDGTMEVYTTPAALDQVRHALEGMHLKVVNAEATMLPKSTVTADDDTALRVLKLIDRLEDLDDVQKVYSNIDLPESVLERAAANE